MLKLPAYLHSIIKLSQVLPKLLEIYIVAADRRTMKNKICRAAQKLAMDRFDNRLLRNRPN